MFKEECLKQEKANQGEYISVLPERKKSVERVQVQEQSEAWINLIRLFLANGSWFAIRPSGTEPKIKFYFYSNQDSREKALAVNKKIRDEILDLIKGTEHTVKEIRLGTELVVRGSTTGKGDT